MTLLTALPLPPGSTSSGGGTGSTARSLDELHAIWRDCLFDRGANVIITVHPKSRSSHVLITISLHGPSTGLPPPKRPSCPVNTRRLTPCGAGRCRRPVGSDTVVKRLRTRECPCTTVRNRMRVPKRSEATRVIHDHAVDCHAGVLLGRGLLP